MTVCVGRGDAHVEDKAGRQITHGQRLTAATVGQQEPALVVDRPDHIGCGGLGQRRAQDLRPGACPRSGWKGEVGLLQCPVQSAERRQSFGAWMVASEEVVQFFSAPMRMLVA